jgi:predicted transcriptional regulator
MRFNPKKINLDQKGVSKVLGTLEAGIMETVWDGGTLTVREVVDRMRGTKRYSFNTIMTVMNRLVEKGLLSKKEAGGSFAYAARKEREAFLADVSRSVFAALLSDAATFQLAAFVEALEDASADDVRKLRDIIDGKSE